MLAWRGGVRQPSRRSPVCVQWLTVLSLGVLRSERARQRHRVVARIFDLGGGYVWALLGEFWSGSVSCSRGSSAPRSVLSRIYPLSRSLPLVSQGFRAIDIRERAVSYTHLTLPTIYSV